MTRQMHLHSAGASFANTAVVRDDAGSVVYDQRLTVPPGLGVDASCIEACTRRCVETAASLAASRATAQARFLAWFDRADEPADMIALAERYRRTCRDVVILGVGGAVLSGAAVLPMRPAGDDGPRVHVLENPDPDRLDALLHALTPEATGVLAVSKSGTTTETLMLVAAFARFFEQSGHAGRLGDHLAVMTQPGDSPLGRVADRHGLPRLAHDSALTGRFSAGQTALVPALVAGVDTGAMRAGARAVVDAVLETPDPAGTPPVLGAAVHAALAQTGRLSQSVLMPYRNAWQPFTRWFCQLWAESLGKDDRGITPIPALGCADQHSQLQLFCDGPKDKLITLVHEAEQAQCDPPDADPLSDSDLGVYAAPPMREALRREALATRSSLIQAGCPVRSLTVPALGAYSLGALFMHDMLETVMTADLLDVDPFSQPSVDRSKARQRDAT